MDRTACVRWLVDVSILTRAFARVQPPGRPYAPMTLAVSILTRAFARVQPTIAEDDPTKLAVSILTRAFARVQPAPEPLPGLTPSLFQSSLELSPECNPWIGSSTTSTSAFQSSLELSPECNAAPPRRCRQTSGRFNPHSSFRPSATRLYRVPGSGLGVSILTRAFARVQRG